MNNPFILQKIIMTINMLEHVFYEYHEPCEARLSQCGLKIRADAHEELASSRQRLYRDKTNN